MSSQVDETIGQKRSRQDTIEQAKSAFDLPSTPVYISAGKLEMVTWVVVKNHSHILFFSSPLHALSLSPPSQAARSPLLKSTSEVGVARLRRQQRTPWDISDEGSDEDDGQRARALFAKLINAKHGAPSVAMAPCW
jgi:hypothetical protein